MAHLWSFPHSWQKISFFVDLSLKAYVAGVELRVMERFGDISPLCMEIDFKFSEETTRVYWFYHLESVDHVVVSVLNDFLLKRKKQIRCYLFEKNACEGGGKNGFQLVYPDELR